MKKLLLLFVLLLTVNIMYSQDITGDWYGTLEVPGAKLRMVLHINETENGYETTLDSPDQGANGIRVAKTEFVENNLRLELPNIMAVYTGTLKDGKFEGIFNQMGQELKLDFSKEKSEGPKRPQHPTEPFPYKSEEVTFQNKEQDVTLAGTLTLPEKGNAFAAAILITGSGPQNRDEEILEHKPFLVIADYLTRHGIAVLRYDDRGVGESTGEFSGATSADFATDVEAAFSYLKTRKEINSKRIGLIGHSEGGMIAPMVATKHKNVAFVVMLAGTGVDLGEVLLVQQEKIFEAIGYDEEFIKINKEVNTEAYQLIRDTKDANELESKLESYFTDAIRKYPNFNSQINQGVSNKEYIQMLVDTYTDPWMRYAISHDPAVDLKKVKCPVLALNGTKDLQVDAAQNLTAIKSALAKGKNKKVTIHELEGLNHLFQESETGLPTEYGLIEETFSPTALEIMKDWILEKALK